MFGLMQEWPMVCHKVIDHAARQHGHREIVSRSVEGPIVRTTYKDVRLRALKVAQLLTRDGFRRSDRIGTLAWNTGNHLEAWYGIMGMGGVYHTLNPRLFSSIELENIAVGHPEVAEAAVIGIAHPKWDERPLLVVVKKPGKEPTKEQILGYMDGKVAKWRAPDDVVFVPEIPHTATGKIQKTTLRERLSTYRFPTQ